MPIAIALFVRALIQFAITIGVVELAERVALPLLNRAIEGTIRFFGVGEEEAKDIVANEYINALEQIGIGALTIKSKTPTKIAEKLGFTSRGFAKRPLKSPTKAKVDAAKAGKPLPNVIAPKDAGEILTAVAESRGLLNQKAKDVITLISVGIGLPTGVAFTIAQYIDFGSWESGAYTTQFQKILSNFGLQPDKPMPSSKVLSKDMWSRIKATYETDGAVAITDPYTGTTKTFTTENLIDLVDRVAADIVTNGGSPSFKNVIAATTGFIIRRGQAPAITAPHQTTPSSPSITVAPLSRKKTTFPTSTDALANLALPKVAAFLDSLAGRLDFELNTRKNPINENGSFLSGEYYTLAIQLRTGQFSKTKLQEIILRPLAEGEKKLSKDEEEPFEAAIRQAAGATVPTTALATPALSAPSEQQPVPTPLTEQSFPAAAANTLLRYAKWEDDFIVDFRADVHLPNDIATPPVRGRSPDITPEGLEKLKADIKSWSNETDEGILNYIKDSITEWRRDDHLRSLLSGGSLTQFGGHEKITQEYGGLTEFGLFLLNKRRRRGSLTQTASGRPLFVRFDGSPDVFDRRSGQFQTFAMAKEKGLFNPGMVEQLPNRRPEVADVSDYPIWSGRDLTTFPV